MNFKRLRFGEKKETNLNLIEFANVVNNQLTRMGIKYILKLMLNKSHESIVTMNSKGEVVGGVCFRVNKKIKLVELVFLAVLTEEQANGFASKLLNHFKMQMVKEGNLAIMTYADNQAVSFFRKFGFNQKILIPQQVYVYYIKDYESATLMECFLDNRIDYANLKGIIDNWKREVINRIKLRNQDAVVKYTRDKRFRTGQTYYFHSYMMDAEFKTYISQILFSLYHQPFSWPFRKIDANKISGYKDLITNEMDLVNMESKLNNNEYNLNKEEFIHDLELIVSNSRIFNVGDKTYLKCTDKFEEFCKPFINKIREKFINK